MFRRAALWLAVLLCAGWPAHAQTIYPPINSPVFRALDANGKPLAGGKLFSYMAGTSTPQPTYADAGGATPNSNPVILDSTGQAKIFLAPLGYKFVLQDANGVQQWTVDNVSGNPFTAPVTSVFGRTGDVLAQSGDYSCGQITGAICSLPTVFYQTVKANGGALTQRGNLNLIAGTNITVACVDNSGSNQTDCTVTAAGTSVPSRTCNANGCYILWPDGTIDAWGVSSAVGSNTTATNLTITFPVPFTTTSNLIVTVSAVSDAAGDGNPHPADCHIQRGLLTTTGVTSIIAIPTQVTGSGYDHLIAGDYCAWHAKGN
jgi:hypothetical protein